MDAGSKSAGYACGQCNTPLHPASTFCNHCGALQTSGDELPTQDKWNLLQQAGLFYLLNLAVCLGYKYIHYVQNLIGLSVFYIISAAITLIFFGLNFRENKQLLGWPGFQLKWLLIFSLIAIIASFGVSFSVDWINHVIFPKTIFYDIVFANHKHRVALSILFIAVLPAVFEELAFRGYLLQTVLKVMDGPQAIFITSFLFALLHISFISLFWLIPFALLLGYIRVKTNTIYYGMAIHFFFNLTACIIGFHT